MFLEEMHVNNCAYMEAVCAWGEYAQCSLALSTCVSTCSLCQTARGCLSLQEAGPRLINLKLKCWEELASLTPGS